MLRFSNPFPPVAQAVGNAGATLNANGQMYNIPVSGGGIGGKYFRDLVVSIHSLQPPVTVWAERLHQMQHMLHGQHNKPCCGAGGENGLGGQPVNAGFSRANGLHIGAIGYNPAGQAGL